MDESKPFKVAVRTEGQMVNAYWTSTKGALDRSCLVGSLWLDLCRVPEIREAFQTLMAVCAYEMLQPHLKPGQTISHVDVEDAPEHEKAGNA